LKSAPSWDLFHIRHYFIIVNGLLLETTTNERRNKCMLLGNYLFGR